MFSKLLFDTPDKIQQCKTKLITYLASEIKKFDSFLKKNTDLEDAEAYLEKLQSESVDPIIEMVIL